MTWHGMIWYDPSLSRRRGIPWFSCRCSPVAWVAAWIDCYSSSWDAPYTMTSMRWVWPSIGSSRALARYLFACPSDPTREILAAADGWPASEAIGATLVMPISAVLWKFSFCANSEVNFITDRRVPWLNNWPFSTAIARSAWAEEA